MTEKNIKVRTAVPADAAALVAIYAPYVKQTAISFEYEVPSEEEFRQRMVHTLERYPYLVAEIDGETVGYAYAGPFVGREAYRYSAEVSIYVERHHRGSGVGGTLYGELERILSGMHILNLYACIGCPKNDVQDEHLNMNSVHFHTHMGYRMAGRFHDCGFKFGTWYDMVWMEKILEGHPDAPEEVVWYPEYRRRE